MADQEFLASFGIDIDENGVSRLQKILAANPDFKSVLYRRQPAESPRPDFDRTGTNLTYTLLATTITEQ